MSGLLLDPLLTMPFILLVPLLRVAAGLIITALSSIFNALDFLFIPLSFSFLFAKINCQNFNIIANHEKTLLALTIAPECMLLCCTHPHPVQISLKISNSFPLIGSLSVSHLTVEQSSHNSSAC